MRLLGTLPVWGTFALSQNGGAEPGSSHAHLGSSQGRWGSRPSDGTPRAELFLTVLRNAEAEVSIKSPRVTGPREATLIIETVVVYDLHKTISRGGKGKSASGPVPPLSQVEGDPALLSFN